jgi:isoamylase
VSYDDKHNEANGEDNRDGTSGNRSWNCGAEGPTDDPAVLSLRARQSRAMLTTLLLSFGIPMLLGGDEMGRTQQGNNNAYCQDNEITWFDWTAPDTDLLDFTKQLVALRKAHPVFRRNRYQPAPKHPSCAGSPRRAPDDRSRLVRPERAGHRAVPRRIR